MALQVEVLELRERLNFKRRNILVLSPSDWDDYSFKTSFNAYYCDESGSVVELGTVKIGYRGQAKGWTRDTIPRNFEKLPVSWFSLGQDVKYYRVGRESIDSAMWHAILTALNDVAYDQELLSELNDERVLRESLLRGVSLSTVTGQFRRVLAGRAELTNFEFAFEQTATKQAAPIRLDFRVQAESMPSTNVHVLIGRNGVGKTTILNNLVGALTDHTPFAGPAPYRLYRMDPFLSDEPLPKDYFSSVVSVSFSAFDPFIPPEDTPSPPTGPSFHYVGMKGVRRGAALQDSKLAKSNTDLVADFVTGFRACISQPAKKERWRAAVDRLGSDPNFADMDLASLLLLEDEKAVQEAESVAIGLSSGHSIVLLTVTKLVDCVQEKTLVLVDEPESHLHPPLLSAFTRALSDLLHARNGVAIVATHSPVVLQEVPRSCVWKITRSRSQSRADRPERETFGENVGILTREVFGLEVSKSGFHELLGQSVAGGATYDEILSEYSNQLGTEGRAILLAMITARDSQLDVET